ncbi:putative protein MADS AFFECTING FLOWERING 5-like isoform X2 [Capsicum annuum]|nr:putative protein MADS AFFECTING FLOWERING 5-like isoform X2 [Capsicum annuum]
MGRRKVEIKRIQDKNCRQVAFCKRRKGLLKKAKELSILCDVDVGVVIISNRGRLHEFASTNRSSSTLRKHRKGSEESCYNILDLSFYPKGFFNDTKATPQQKKRSLQKSRTQRQLEENVDGVTATDLIHLENELLTALVQIRSRKVFLHSSVASPTGIASLEL